MCCRGPQDDLHPINPGYLDSQLTTASCGKAGWGGGVVFSSPGKRGDMINCPARTSRIQTLEKTRYRVHAAWATWDARRGEERASSHAPWLWTTWLTCSGCDWWNFKTLSGHHQQTQPFGSRDASLNTHWFDWWSRRPACLAAAQSSVLLSIPAADDGRDGRRRPPDCGPAEITRKKTFSPSLRISAPKLQSADCLVSADDV